MYRTCNIFDEISTNCGSQTKCVFNLIFHKKHQQVPAKRNRKRASVNDKNSHESNQSTDPKRLWERAFGCRMWSRRAIKYPRSCKKPETSLRKRWEILKCMQALISSIYPLQGIHKCALSALYFFLIASRTSDLRSHFKVRKLKSPKKKKKYNAKLLCDGGVSVARTGTRQRIWISPERRFNIYANS